MLRFLSLLFVFCFVSVSAQNIDVELNNLQRAKIGLVDEFIKRFNGVECHPDSTFSNADSRKNNLLLLFDLSQFVSRNDTAFIEASLMMDRVIEDSVQLNYCDSAWFAISHCKGIIEKEEVSFDLILNVKLKQDSLYTWEIVYACGDVFNIEPRNKSDRAMLYPDDHETNFISLMRMTEEQPFNVRKFIYNEFEYDATSVFAYLVHCGKLKISHVEKLEFVFTQIQGYIFHIENIERDTANSGWLITKFHKIHNEDKVLLFDKLYLRETTLQISEHLRSSCDKDNS